MLSPPPIAPSRSRSRGTLRPGAVARLSRRAVLQMRAPWMDKADSPGMAAWDLQSEVVYGAAVAVNFADMTLRAAVSEDFVRWHPVPALAELVNIAEPR